MSGKKHIFKMVPGQRVFNETRMRIFQDSVDGEELTWNNFDKIGFIPLDDEDSRVLDLPIKFCNASSDGPLTIVACIKENGKDLKKTSYRCDKEEGLITNCKFPFVPFRNAKLDYENNLHSFVYLNEKLMKISIDYEVSQPSDYSTRYICVFKAQPVEYKYVTWDESSDTYTYYFSDDQGNIIESHDNQALQYIERHVKEEVIQDIILSKIPEDIILSKTFAKIFVEKTTHNQLETIANTLNSDQLQVLVGSLTDEQLQALVHHLTDHQLQALAHELNPEKLQIIVPLLKEDQVIDLVKNLNIDQVGQIFPHLKMDQLQVVIKTMSNDQFVKLIKDAPEQVLSTLFDEALKNRLPTLVKTLEEDTLHNLVKKLDHDKLAIVARELTDSDKIQMVIEALENNPDKLQALANSMSREQFKELLDNIDVEELKDIIHKLPHEKVISVIGDLGSKDQSNAIIDALKEKFDKQSESINELHKKLEEFITPPPMDSSYDVMEEGYYELI